MLPSHIRDHMNFRANIACCNNAISCIFFTPCRLQVVFVRKCFPCHYNSFYSEFFKDLAYWRPWGLLTPQAARLAQCRSTGGIYMYMYMCICTRISGAAGRDATPPPPYVHTRIRGTTTTNNNLIITTCSTKSA